MLKTGMIIGERYEIVGKVGSGGMADVYKAKDHKLNRYVAVKVLKQEFREDTTFIKKFKTEAQSAAGLTHPNIVNVFDVGDDDGVHYIVMELVEGITLKDYISKKGKLSVKESTSIAIQVSMGLEAAHSHGIIHRDVKPQNIIISTDGKVKVTDFGIARAASSNTISSNVMGSVHYSSPEQVRGGYSDEKSDIYSLGITLYEMVTGKVPFDGETTVAIAIKHLQDEMVIPSAYTPEIPHSLEQIILKCTQKSVDRRYGNMEEVIADLKHSLIDPQGDFVQLASVNPTDKTTVIGQEELGEIKKKREAAPAPAPRKESFIIDDEDDDDEVGRGGINRRLEKAMTIGGLIIGILIICVLIFFIVQASGILKIGSGNNSKDSSQETKQPAEEDLVEVPNLVGKTEDEAVEIVKELRIGIRCIGEETSDQYDKGLISSQTTEPGTKVELYTTIEYKISSGTATVSLPDVEGRTQSEAEKLLSDLGFVVNVSKSYSYDYPAGQVMTMNPEAGTELKAGESVNLEVSMGSQYNSFYVPDVLNMTEGEAKDALAPLDITVQSQTSDTVEAGLVMSQSVAEGVYVDAGSQITITVSTGAAGTTPEPTTTVAATGTWKCTQILDTPVGYAGGVVKLELVQTVNGAPVASTAVDGKQLEFPYQLDIEGVPGLTEGVLYLSELVGSDYVELGHYTIKFEQVEE